MVAATALFTTTVADAIVGGYRGAPGTASVVWPAVLRNAGIVAMMTVALGSGEFQVSMQSALLFAAAMSWVFALRLVRKDTDQKTAMKRTASDAIVVGSSFLLVVPLLMAVSQLSNVALTTVGGPSVPSVGQMSDNVKILLALAVLYNNGRATAGSVLKHVGLVGLKDEYLAALGVGVLFLARRMSRRAMIGF